MALKFNPETGYSDQASFPTVPASEAEARADLQEIPNQIRDYINKYLNYADDTGAADAYAVTLDPAPANYAAPLMVFFKAVNANTGASTLNVNSLGVKAIRKNGTAVLESGDISAGAVVCVVYDGTNFQLIGTTATAQSNLTTHAAVKASLSTLGHIKVGSAGSIDADGVYTPGGYKVIVATHDASVTGTQAITGVGFTPRMVKVTANIDTSIAACFGVAQGISAKCLTNHTTGGQWKYNSAFVDVVVSSGNEPYAGVPSFDSDGITLTWAKVGSPTGTINMILEFFR